MKPIHEAFLEIFIGKKPLRLFDNREESTPFTEPPKDHPLRRR